MFGGNAFIIASSTTGPPPASSLVMSGPFGPCGVWQLPQLIGPRTRYSPRSTGVSAQAMDAATQSAAAQTPVLKLICRPPRPRRLASRWASDGAGRLAPAPKPVNAMPDPAVSIAPVRSDEEVAAASQLAREFFAYMRAHYPEKRAAIEAYLIIQDFEGQLAAFRDHFNPPHGDCMLARLDGAPVGVVMLKPYDTPGVCELNRMYVADAARGRGVGRALCEALLAQARALGYREVRLDVLNARVEALPLYRKLGFGPDPRSARLRPQRARRHLAAHAPLDKVPPMPARISRATYADMYGPTTGDKVRLADTELIIEVERDFTTYGEEVKFGGGKVIRDGMGQSQATRAEGAVDTVITNALIVDHTGIYKADVGLKDGRIAAIGKAGNPDTQPGVTIIIGPSTEAIAGEGKILTAGGFDAHIHFIAPQQIEEALMRGITTMLGGGTGPAHGTLATTCTGAWHIERMIESLRRLPDEPRRSPARAMPASPRRSRR